MPDSQIAKWRKSLGLGSGSSTRGRKAVAKHVSPRTGRLVSTFKAGTTSRPLVRSGKSKGVSRARSIKGRR